jgi:hypothetical protein
MTGTGDSTHLISLRFGRGVPVLFLSVAFGASVPFVLAYLAAMAVADDVQFRSMAPFGRTDLRRSRQLGLRRVCTPTWSPVSALAKTVDRAGWSRGVALGLALGVGFALPLVLVGVPIRVALVLAGRRSLG